MTTRALITGVTGQDGSYLAELLLEKGYEVYGIVRRASVISTGRINHLLFPTEKVKLVYGDLGGDIESLIADIKPDFVFNMASMSHVRVSFDVPIYTLDINAIGPMRILEAIRHSGLKGRTRYYNAASSEMFGMSAPPQNEDTIFHPCSPYGIAKLASYWITRTYRDAYGIFAANGILFNHESIRRGETFVTKKIVRGAVRIKLDKQKDLVLGNLGAKRDWGHSKDYMRAIHAIITHDHPDDFVVATGTHLSIMDFVTKVFDRLDLDWQKYIRYDEKYTRPKEVPELCGDPTKIKKILKWEPQINIDALIDEMVSGIMDEEQHARD